MPDAGGPRVRGSPDARRALPAARRRLRELREDLVRLGEPPFGLLREEELLVGHDVELARLAPADLRG